MRLNAHNRGRSDYDISADIATMKNSRVYRVYRRVYTERDPVSPVRNFRVQVAYLRRLYVYGNAGTGEGGI